jgi:hypothetical protein
VSTTRFREARRRDAAPCLAFSRHAAEDVDVDDATATIDGERAALEAGLTDVRDSFARWNRDVSSIVRVWMGTSLLVGLGLLLATWLVSISPLIGEIVPHASFSQTPTLGAALELVRRNSLVLAMHALICVAGYMALTSMPIVARGYTGWKRSMHLAAVPVTIVFVTLVTIGSFVLQAWSLGIAAPGIAAAYDLATWQLLLLVSPHALPELTAIFLPLGAWLVLARRHAYGDLLAASVLATAVAIPLLAISTITEVWITPRLLELLVT